MLYILIYKLVLVQYHRFNFVSISLIKNKNLIIFPKFWKDGGSNIYLIIFLVISKNPQDFLMKNKTCSIIVT